MMTYEEPFGNFPHNFITEEPFLVYRPSDLFISTFYEMETIYNLFFFFIMTILPHENTL
ncbi:hypothetical protein SACS_1530 [Parasaccharibacter apium]|uniref:Uncharacterized protein n=1 Tax=Parasaccharibacter apium TaxID=1510841 RepID=A0A7U7G6Z4_9PROT|nr:hypothetical protein SACS_1530 [Parasaccharibacter apium]